MNKGKISMMLIIIIALTVILDRVSKILAVKYLLSSSSVTVIKNVLDLTLTKNTGAAFSIFEGKALILGIFSIVISAALCFLLYRQQKLNRNKKLYLISIAMIIGGALGNAIDRFAYGYVVDFFEFTFVNFAIFNVADAFLTIGAIIMCACILLDREIKL